MANRVAGEATCAGGRARGRKALSGQTPAFGIPAMGVLDGEPDQKSARIETARARPGCGISSPAARSPAGTAASRARCSW